MKNKMLKGLLLSAASLVVGFIAISLPFRLFTNLTDSAMEVIFIAEILIYLFVGLAFLVIKDKQSQKRTKAEIRHARRREKIERVQREWIDIAA